MCMKTTRIQDVLDNQLSLWKHNLVFQLCIWAAQSVKVFSVFCDLSIQISVIFELNIEKSFNLILL